MPISRWPTAVALPLILIGSLMAAPRASATATAPVGLLITRVECVTSCDSVEPDGLGDPDFYARVKIADGPEHETPRVEDDVFNPGWVIEEQVDTALTSVPVTVQMWDADDVSADDKLDLGPQAGVTDLRFTIDRATWVPSGDLNSRVGCVQGDGEPDFPAVRVCLEILPPDSDRDGLFDIWETNGVDADGDGVVDLPLNAAPYNADPGRKDLFVEADWMECGPPACASAHSHAPQPGVLADVVAAFRAAPVPNPGSTNGITLHVMQDEAIPEVNPLRYYGRDPGTNDDFQDLKIGGAAACDGHFGTVADRAAANCAAILAAKRDVFRYTIFAHSPMPDADTSLTTSGLSDFSELGGDDFLVSLGAWTNSMITGGGGQRAVEAGTFMHELGHTLGLGHGGRSDAGLPDGINCKPNYFSVMSYVYQTLAGDAARPLDFQATGQGTLVEAGGLDETADPALPRAGNRQVVYGVGGNRRSSPADHRIDWTGDGLFQTGRTADINFIRLPAINTLCPSGPGQTLIGWPDWDRIVYDFGASPLAAPGVTPEQGEPELTGEQVAALNPPADLSVTKTVDKADAAAGDTLTYTVTGANKGPAKAVSVSVTDTLPGGATDTRNLPDLADGERASETFTYRVPCATADGTTVTNRVTITGTSENRVPETGTLSDNSAEAVTRVHAPAPDLDVFATPAVNAGEAVTYTIRYRDTGSAPATDATVTQTLPADVYYSTALDQGGGPRPDTVTREPDGRTTLRWQVGDLQPGGPAQTITFTARPSLLVPGGTNVTARASLTSQGANDCASAPVTATAATAIGTAPISGAPRASLLWATLPGLRTAETLARTQATDTRYDTGGDGSLSQQETTAALALPLLQPRTLRAELLACYLNLADRRLNAGTPIHSPTSTRLGLATVREAAAYARATLDLPPAANLARYTEATLLLTELNTGLATHH